MTPRGGEALIAMRKAGKRPAADVWLTYGNGADPDWWRWAESKHSPELLVRPADPIERLDLRCLVGLPLFAVFEKWDDKAAQLHDRLTEYASEIAVMSPSFGDDIGWFWHKRYGKINWAERHLLTALERCGDDRAIASKRNDATAYAAATAREMKILEAAPWLK